MRSTPPGTAIVLCCLTVSLAMTAVRAGGENVAFPQDYARHVKYASHDLADVKEYREIYITPAAIGAARNDQPLPSGTIITLVRYNVQLNERGNPLRDDNGRLIKTQLKAFRVMEKRTGWGSEYPQSKRNGEWEYQAFLPDGKVDGRADLENCFQCHKNGDGMNFMFTSAQLKSAVK